MYPECTTLLSNLARKTLYLNMKENGNGCFMIRDALNKSACQSSRTPRHNRWSPRSVSAAISAGMSSYLALRYSKIPSRKLSKTQNEKKYKIRRANNRKAPAIRRTKRVHVH